VFAPGTFVLAPCVAMHTPLEKYRELEQVVILGLCFLQLRVKLFRSPRNGVMIVPSEVPPGGDTGSCDVEPHDDDESGVVRLSSILDPLVFMWLPEN